MLPQEEHIAYLNALRTYPLVDFDYERVAVRAYYLGEKSHDSIANWLAAERQEAYLQGHSSLSFAPSGVDFLLEYQLVNSVRFLTNEPLPKEVRGNGRVPVCAICGQSGADRKFRTEAHLLPACTGNRYLFTADECDDCNLNSGRETENELGNMLAPHRAIHQIQTRSKPSTKFRKDSSGSSIGGQARGEPLNVTLREGSSTIRMSDVGPNTVRIEIDGTPYRPTAALRSLGRAAWHLLGPKDREDLRGFLDWITGSTAFVPMPFGEAVIPGPGLRHTTFAVWRGTSAAGDPNVVFMLTLGTLALVGAYPPCETSKFPTPPLPMSPYGATQMRVITIQKDAVVQPQPFYDMRYLSRALHSLSETEEADLVADAGGTSVSIRTRVSVQSTPEDIAVHKLRYVVAGGYLSGAIGIVGTPRHLDDAQAVAGGDYIVSFEPPVPGSGDASTINEATAALLQCLHNGGALTVRLARTGQTVVAIGSAESRPVVETSPQDAEP